MMKKEKQIKKEQKEGRERKQKEIKREQAIKTKKRRTHCPQKTWSRCNLKTRLIWMNKILIPKSLSLRARIKSAKYRIFHLRVCDLLWRLFTTENFIPDGEQP